MKLNKITKNGCVLLIINIQEKLANVMTERKEFINNSVKLISGIKAFNIPIIVAEQNPHGIGPTIEPIRKALDDDYKPITKFEFSCLANEDFFKKLKELNGITDLIIAGIETHICVFQTVQDALNEGYNVHLVTDATTSRNRENKRMGIDACKDMGTRITSSEMILLQLLKSAQSNEFRTISQIIK